MQRWILADGSREKQLRGAPLGSGLGVYSWQTQPSPIHPPYVAALRPGHPVEPIGSLSDYNFSNLGPGFPKNYGRDPEKRVTCGARFEEPPWQIGRSSY